MPVRFLRPTIRQSERWNRCSYMEQSFYIRLITLVDDYGRYEGHPALLASECFPYGDEMGLPVQKLKVDGMLRSLASKGLITVYESDEGKQFVRLERWCEKPRSASKFPDPASCKVVWGGTVSKDDTLAGCERESAESLENTQVAVQVQTFANSCEQMRTSPPSPSPSPSPSPTPSPGAGKCVRVEEVVRSATPNPETTVNGRFEALQEALCDFYKRPVKVFGVSSEEHHLLAEIARRDSAQKELREIRTYHDQLPSKRYFPQSAVRLLQAWDQTLDRARSYSPETDSKPKSVFELKSVIEAKKELAQDLKNKYLDESGAFERWKDKERRAQYFALLKEIKELTARLSRM